MTASAHLSSREAGPGLRERKKAKTRATIQHHALALFRAQGYAATTVGQIAGAAEVSESTFFRYFPTKEDVVVTDDVAALFTATFRAQPHALGVVAALRSTVRSVVETMSEPELADWRLRGSLIFAVPELWGAALVQLTDGSESIAGLVAERLGRDRHEVVVRAFAGAMTGVVISLLRTWSEHPDVDLLASLDEALTFLESGLPLERGAR